MSIVGLTWAPVVIQSDCNEEGHFCQIGGFMGELLSHLSQSLNFTYDYWKEKSER